MNSIHESVKDYYGNQLQTSEDLKTDACCTMEAPPKYVIEGLKQIHEDVKAKYYGCGFVVPLGLSGQKVLDLGCGAGQDVYLLSQLVGESGSVVGVDMTSDQLGVAKSFSDYHSRKFGYSQPNTHFLLGELEQLDKLDLNRSSFDIIVSNCVINLVTDKKKVLASAHDLLAEGGELYFSDVYADRRIPESLQKDPVLYGECLSGAMYWNDFQNLSRHVGFSDPRVVSCRPLQINDAKLKEKLGEIQFYSVTYRLFKISDLEFHCEDYGQAIRYKGTLDYASQSFELDDHHKFETGKFYEVCGNTFLMLQKSRFAEHFDFFGDFERHYGIFEGCGQNAPFASLSEGSSEALGCC